MKKYHYLWLFVIPILFVMCDGVPDGVVSATNTKYKMSSLNAPTYFLYSEASNKFVTSLKLENSNDITDIYFTVKFADGSSTLIAYQQLFDDGNTISNGDVTKSDNVFSAYITMKPEYFSTDYLIDYYITYKTSTQTITQKIASHSFSYDNGANLSAPVISNINVPDSIVVGEPKSTFLISVEATDSNGLSDINEVFFKVIKPDGTSNGNKFMLYDNKTNGDVAAGDGIYSSYFDVYPTNTKGVYAFNFQAKDRSGKLSNIISHQIKLK